MSLPAIKNRQQLQAHLQLLEEKEKFYRARLVSDATEIVSFVQDPAAAIKRTVKSLASDGDFRGDLLNIGANYLVGYLGEKLKSGNLPGWITALIGKFGGNKNTGE
jgi:hypothetical protein